MVDAPVTELPERIDLVLEPMEAFFLNAYVTIGMAHVHKECDRGHALLLERLLPRIMNSPAAVDALAKLNAKIATVQETMTPDRLVTFARRVTESRHL